MLVAFVVCYNQNLHGPRQIALHLISVIVVVSNLVTRMEQQKTSSNTESGGLNKELLGLHHALLHQRIGTWKNK